MDKNSQAAEPTGGAKEAGDGVVLLFEGEVVHEINAAAFADDDAFQFATG